ncbi:MAG: CHASE2 domain-containing protein [Chitinivibrionales bacterium]|nr:CHASE2 domain-containing protein [Chitinivibrionales bacterium]
MNGDSEGGRPTDIRPVLGAAGRGADSTAAVQGRPTAPPTAISMKRGKTRSDVRRILTAVAVLAALCTTGLLLGQLPAFEKLELSTIDFRMRRYAEAFSVEQSPIVIVDIGDESYDALHAIWPWSRSYYARAIRNLYRAGARLVVIDIVFEKPHPDYPGGDDSLAQALRSHPRTILAGKTFHERRRFLWHKRIDVGDHSSIVSPAPLFLDSAEWALADVNEDLDNVVRTYYTRRRLSEEHELRPTLALMAYERARNGDALPWLDKPSFRIAFPGGPRSFPYRPFYQVVDDSTLWTRDEAAWEEENNWYDTLLAHGVFRDKIVFIGSSMAELRDEMPTPFSARAGGEVALVPGVEVHAAALHTLLNGYHIRDAGAVPVYALLLLCCAGLFALGAVAPTWLYLTIVGALGVGWWYAAFGAFGAWSVVVPITPPLVTIGTVTAGQLAYLFYLEQIRRREVTGMFGHYVPPAVVRELVRNPDKARLGGERRELTVLFCDIVGFTTISEQLPAERVVELLNEYLTAMTEIIHDEGGIIDKYEGDLIMAEFGIPLPVEDHALRACRTAFRMQRHLHTLRERWQTEGKPLLHVRIGIGTGQMIFGNMGSSQAFDYTVMGDVVNLASRLEGANKSYGTGILINERAAQLVSERMLVREIDLLLVKGKHRPETCYQLVAPIDSPKADTIRRVSALFSEGLTRYREQQWEQAAKSFEQVLEIWDNDAPSLAFIERCRGFMLSPPPPGWNGVFALTSK